MTDLFTDLMIDLETLGKTPGCVVTAIGAVLFNRNGPADQPLVSRSMLLDVRAQQGAGFVLDADTVLWWMKQSDAARMSWASEEAQSAAGLPTVVLGSFRSWVLEKTAPKFTVWANSPSFDLAILEPLWTRSKVEKPWKYYQEADQRTIGLLCPSVNKPKPLVAHSAVEDAKAQASYVIACAGYLRGLLPEVLDDPR